jgi:hypothetical protein
LVPEAARCPLRLESGVARGEPRAPARDPARGGQALPVEGPAARTLHLVREAIPLDADAGEPATPGRACRLLADLRTDGCDRGARL